MSGIGGYSLCQTFCMLVPSIQKSPIRFNPMELNNSNAASAFFLPFYLFTFLPLKKAIEFFTLRSSLFT